MNQPELNLKAVPNRGIMRLATRYTIQNLVTGEFWTGASFSPLSSEARVYHRASTARGEIEEILREHFNDLPSRKYTVPLEVEVFGDVDQSTVVKWLRRAIFLRVLSGRHGHGPKDSLVLPELDWQNMVEMDRPAEESQQDVSDDLATPDSDESQ